MLINCAFRTALGVPASPPAAPSCPSILSRSRLIRFLLCVSFLWSFEVHRSQLKNLLAIPYRLSTSLGASPSYRPSMALSDSTWTQDDAAAAAFSLQLLGGLPHGISQKQVAKHSAARTRTTGVARRRPPSSSWLSPSRSTKAEGLGCGDHQCGDKVLLGISELCRLSSVEDSGELAHPHRGFLTTSDPHPRWRGNSLAERPSHVFSRRRRRLIHSNYLCAALYAC